MTISHNIFTNKYGHKYNYFLLVNHMNKISFKIEYVDRFRQDFLLPN